MVNFLIEELLLNKYSAEERGKIFQKSIINCINNTKKYIQKETDKAGTEYIHPIVTLLLEALNEEYRALYGSQYYAQDYEEYRDLQSNDYPCYLFKDDDCICFSGNDIIKYFETLKDFDYVFTKQAISAQLKNHDLLKCNGGEYSFPCKSANNKKRYYHIDIRKLAEFIYPGENNKKRRKKFIKSL